MGKDKTFTPMFHPKSVHGHKKQKNKKQYITVKSIAFLFHSESRKKIIHYFLGFYTLINKWGQHKTLKAD